MPNQDEKIDSFVDALLTCNACGGELTEVSENELPEGIRIQSENIQSGLIGYLFCPKCDQYSIIGGSNSPFDDFEEESPIKLGMKPSRNATCPCGSSKKYKRCCGKN